MPHRLFSAWLDSLLPFRLFLFFSLNWSALCAYCFLFNFRIWANSVSRVKSEALCASAQMLLQLPARGEQRTCANVLHNVFRCSDPAEDLCHDPHRVTCQPRSPWSRSANTFPLIFVSKQIHSGIPWMSSVLFVPRPEDTGTVEVGLVRLNPVLPTQRRFLFLGLRPMPFALAPELKFENSSVTAKEKQKRDWHVIFTLCKPFDFLLALLHTANENIEVVKVSLNIVEASSMKTNHIVIQLSPKSH